MKKLLVIFMALCLSFAIVSCGKKETNKTTDSTSTETAKDTVFSGNTNST
jgi:lipoprotein